MLLPKQGSIGTFIFLISVMFACVAVAMVNRTVGLAGGNMGIRGIALFFASHRNPVAPVGIRPFGRGCVDGYTYSPVVYTLMYLVAYLL